METCNFWLSTLQDIINIAHRKSSHDVMEAYLKENVPKIVYLFVGLL